MVLIDCHLTNAVHRHKPGRRIVASASRLEYFSENCVLARAGFLAASMACRWRSKRVGLDGVYYVSSRLASPIPLYSIRMSL